MARVNIDFSDLPSRSPVPDGIYSVIIEKIEQKIAKSSGNPMLFVQFGVQDEQYTGRKIFGNFMLSGDGRFMTAQLMKGLGLESEALLDIDTDDLIGMSCTVKVVQEEGQDGEIRNAIKKVL